MPTTTQVTTIAYVAKILEEDVDLLEAIIANDDNLAYGDIVTVWTGRDEANSALTDRGIQELRGMLADARRTANTWRDFLEDFVSDPEVAARNQQWKPR